MVGRKITTNDLWDGGIREINQPDRDPDCPAYGAGQFSWRDGSHRAPVSLCGRNAVQIHERARPADLSELRARLAAVGEVRANEFALRFFAAPYDLTIFPDGRTPDLLYNISVKEGALSDFLHWLQPLLGRWKFDPLTALVTVVIAPLSALILKILAKHLKAGLSYLVDGLLYWLSRIIIHSLAARLTLRRYCALLLHGDNQYLHVPSRHDIKLLVDTIFVTLQLEHHGGSQETYTHSDLFELSNRIRVMGDPGSGKSSLAKRLFRDQCRLGVSTPAKARLPVYLELKTLNIPVSTKEKALGQWLYDHIRSLVASVDVYKVKECFDAYVKTSGLLILLDGLDEVSKSRYVRVSRAVQLLSDKLSVESEQNVVLLTMRTQFYQQINEDFRDSIGQAVFIRPLKPTDIFEFLTRWPSKANQNNMLTQIYRDLTDRPTLREMCSNPLVLAMYVAEYESGPTPIAPESRTEFYKRVTEELLIKRRLRQTGKTPAPSKLREQRERILGRLAYEHLLDLRQPSNSLRWADAVRIVKGVMKCENDSAEVLFQELAKETGLITEERPRESLRFIHLTFCEFLAAYEAVQGQKDGWHNLMRANAEFQKEQSPQTHLRLVEVIPFAAGLVPRVRRHDVMADVSSTSDYRLVARSFLETKAYEHESWSAFADQTRQVLLGTPEERWNEEWLRDLHLFNVVVRDQQQCATYTERTSGGIDLGEFYKTLVSKQQNSLSALLSAYASQDAAAALRLAEICGLDLLVEYPEIIVANLDQNLFFELVLQSALDDDKRFDRWAVLLAEGALRSVPVVAKLSNIGRDPKITARISRVPRRKRWRGRGLESLYGQVITVAVNQSSVPDFCTALAILRCVPPCGMLLQMGAFAAELLWLLWLLCYFGSAIMMMMGILRPHLELMLLGEKFPVMTLISKRPMNPSSKVVLEPA